MLAAVLVSGAAHGAEDCAVATTQMAMNACADAAFRAEDARLNDVWRDMLARLAGQDEAKQQLAASERAWIQFRDAECAFTAGASSGGTIYGMIVAECRTAMTRDRVKQLADHLACREGDLSCPLPPK